MLEALQKLGLIENFSTHGAAVDATIVWTHWLMIALFAFWAPLFVYMLVRFRRSRNTRADYAGMKSHFSTYLEIGVAIVEGGLLVGFAFPAWESRVTRAEELSQDGGAERIRVMAQQFKWNVHYPGPDRIFGRTAAELIDEKESFNFIGLDVDDAAAADDIVPDQGHLHLPVNRPILVDLTTRDVIHSFAIPVMRVKQDAIPGMRIPVWFEPTRTGSWEIACAQLCGNSHYQMKGFVYVHTQAGYEATMAAISLVKQIDDPVLTFSASDSLKASLVALKENRPEDAERLAIAARALAETAYANRGPAGAAEDEEW